MSKGSISNANDFGAVISIIENARDRALKAVNAELIQMYWEVGKYLSDLCAVSSFGDKIIDEVAAYISKTAPALKGFNRRGLYRMRQFYETYRDDEFVSALLTQISWTNHLLIMSKAKSKEERDFYVALAAKIIIPPVSLKDSWIVLIMNDICYRPGSSRLSLCRRMSAIVFSTHMYWNFSIYQNNILNAISEKQ